MYNNVFTRKSLYGLPIKDKDSEINKSRSYLISRIRPGLKFFYSLKRKNIIVLIYE